jgi:DivIVA domain-containing protein
MDITPQLIRETTFHESLRGYNKDEVEDYKQRWAEAVAQLQGRLMEAIERAERAEARALASAGRSESEDVLRRTLVLAQRTADAAVSEAQEQSARLVSEAQAKATGMLDDADVRSRTMVADAEVEAASIRGQAEAVARALSAAAEEEARRAAESTRIALVEEIRSLEARRGGLLDDATALERYTDVQRRSLHDQVASLQTVVSAARASVDDELTRLRRDIDARRDALAASADALHGEVLARHTALDDGLLRLRAPLDDPDLLRAGPVPELSVELAPMAKATSPSSDAHGADAVDDDRDEYVVDDLDEFGHGNDDDEDRDDDVLAEDDVYDDDEDDDYDDEGDDGGSGEGAQALPGMAGFAESLRPSEQRRVIQPDVSGPAEDALEPARWDQPQFGINLSPDDASPSGGDASHTASVRATDQFVERLRQATDDVRPEDPAFEDKATKFFEDNEVPTARRRFGRRS